MSKTPCQFVVGECDQARLAINCWQGPKGAEQAAKCTSAGAAVIAITEGAASARERLDVCCLL